PNPEAKPHSADGTALARVWESRTPPHITFKVGPHHQVRAYFRFQLLTVQGAQGTSQARGRAGSWCNPPLAGPLPGTRQRRRTFAARRFLPAVAEPPGCR